MIERDTENEIGTNAARDWEVYAERVCVHCGGALHQNETSADVEEPLVWVHENGNIDCAPKGTDEFGVTDAEPAP